MNVRKVLEKLGITKKELKPQLSGGGSWLRLTAQRADYDVYGSYATSAWVYSAINAIARNIASVPTVLTKNDTEVTSGALYDLLQKPNFITVWLELIQSTVIFLELYGDAIWVIERQNITQRPKEIWCFNPTRFQPLFDEKNNFYAWQYSYGSVVETFDLHEIVYFKNSNPYSDIRGLAPLNSAVLAITQDYYASEFNKNFFKEGVALSGVIEVPDELSDEAYQRLQQSFDDKYKGYSRSHRVALLEGGGRFVPITPSYREFEFINLRRMNKEEILTAFGVNPVVVGDYSAIRSYEGIRAALVSFWNETLVPKIKYISDVININFISKIEGGGYKLTFNLNAVESLRDNFYRKVDAAERLYQIGLPVNMINEKLELGFDNVEWGDVWWVADNKIPATDYMYGGNTNGESKSLNEYKKIIAFERALQSYMFTHKKEVFKTIDKSTYKTLPFIKVANTNVDDFKNSIMEKILVSFNNNKEYADSRLNLIYETVIENLNNDVNNKVAQLLDEGAKKQYIKDVLNSVYEDYLSSVSFIIQAEILNYTQVFGKDLIKSGGDLNGNNIK